MGSPWRLAGLGVIFAAAVAACGGDDHGGGGQSTTPPSMPTTVGFEPFAQQEVQQATCQTTTPVPVAGVNFIFGADQDTAEPRDISKVVPGCKD